MVFIRNRAVPLLRHPPEIVRIFQAAVYRTKRLQSKIFFPPRDTIFFHTVSARTRAPFFRVRFQYRTDILARVRRMISVSYTHLDVYKRQE